MKLNQLTTHDFCVAIFPRPQSELLVQRDWLVHHCHMTAFWPINGPACCWSYDKIARHSIKRAVFHYKLTTKNDKEMWQNNCRTYGSFMRMKRRHMKNERRMQTKATDSRSIRFSRGVDGLFVWSSTTNPSPPIVKRKLDARPSIIYWPLTRYCINAT